MYKTLQYVEPTLTRLFLSCCYCPSVGYFTSFRVAMRYARHQKHIFFVVGLERADRLPSKPFVALERFVRV